MVRGDMTKYARMLALFIDGHARNAAKLAAEMAANNLVAIKQLAHGLKGVAGNIGASRVADAAAALDSAVHAQAATHDIETCCTSLIDELNSLVGSLQTAMKEG